MNGGDTERSGGKLALLSLCAAAGRT
jgi:hypothetical protein